MSTQTDRSVFEGFLHIVFQYYLGCSSSFFWNKWKIDHCKEKKPKKLTTPRIRERERKESKAICKRGAQTAAERGQIESKRSVRA
jgi:hypothetical protein